MEGLSSKKRIGDDSIELGFELPEVKRIKEDLLENFNDNDWEIYAASQELESFIKSFQEEIASANLKPKVMTYTTMEANAMGPDLDYLLGASDDELGLPSSSKKWDVERTELGRAEFDSSESNCHLLGCDDKILGFDSFDLGAVNAENYGNEYVVLDGLFDYSDPNFEFLDVAWRHGTLLAK